MGTHQQNQQRAMGDFIVRAADARVAFYDGTWILNAMIE